MSDTVVVGARMDPQLKARVEAKASARGWSARDIITRAYRFIDEHDEVPWMEAEGGGRGADEAFALYERLVKTQRGVSSLGSLGSSGGGGR